MNGHGLRSLSGRTLTVWVGHILIVTALVFVWAGIDDLFVALGPFFYGIVVKLASGRVVVAVEGAEDSSAGSGGSGAVASGLGLGGLG